MYRGQVSTWSSGTGAAGVAGSLSYAGLTAVHVSPRTTLLIMLVVPCLLFLTSVHSYVYLSVWYAVGHVKAEAVFAMIRVPVLVPVRVIHTSEALTNGAFMVTHTTYKQTLVIQLPLKIWWKLWTTLNFLQTFTPISLVMLYIAIISKLHYITAWAVATSCCISDVSSQWEGAIFDPP